MGVSAANFDGTAVKLRRPARRIVSLVPSIS
jgi:hypothetical protein